MTNVNSTLGLKTDIKRDARAWSRFTGLSYTTCLRMMEHPLAQGILGDRISARALIAVLEDHPVIGGTSSTGDPLLGAGGMHSTHPLPVSSTDGFLTVVLCAEMLRMFTPIESPTPPAIDELPDLDDPWHGSYGLKEIAEKFLEPVYGYVTNGQLICAAAVLGLPMAPSFDATSPNTVIALPAFEYLYVQKTLGRGGSVSKAHQHRPPGYQHLRDVLDQPGAGSPSSAAPGRWAGVDLHAELKTSPFHEWLIAQRDPSGARGEFATRENVAADYLMGVEAGDHRVATNGADLLLILLEVGAHPEFFHAAESAVADWDTLQR